MPPHGELIALPVMLQHIEQRGGHELHQNASLPVVSVVCDAHGEENIGVVQAHRELELVEELL